MAFPDGERLSFRHGPSLLVGESEGDDTLVALGTGIERQAAGHALLESHAVVAPVVDGGTPQVVADDVDSHRVRVLVVQRVLVGAGDAYGTVGQRCGNPSHQRVYLIDALVGVPRIGHVLILSVLDDKSSGEVSFLETTVAYHLGIESALADISYLFVVPAIDHARHLLCLCRGDGHTMVLGLDASGHQCCQHYGGKTFVCLHIIVFFSLLSYSRWRSVPS